MPGLNKSFQWNLVLVIGWFEEVENEQQAGNLAKNCACCVNSIVSNVLRLYIYIYSCIESVSCFLSLPILVSPLHEAFPDLSRKADHALWFPTVPRNIDHTIPPGTLVPRNYKSVFLESLSSFLGQQWYGGSGQKSFFFPRGLFWKSLCDSKYW